jgi:hypothetical protein
MSYVTGYHDIPNNLLTQQHFGKGLKSKYKPTMPQLKAFIQLRDPNIATNKTLLPVYKSLSKMSSEQLIDQCFKVKSLPVQKRLFSLVTPTSVHTNEEKDNIAMDETG